MNQIRDKLFTVYDSDISLSELVKRVGEIPHSEVVLEYEDGTYLQVMRVREETDKERIEREQKQAANATVVRHSELMIMHRLMAKYPDEVKLR